VADEPIGSLPVVPEPEAGSRGVSSWIAVPILVDGNLWGGIGLESVEARAWPPAQLDALRAATGAVGAAIARDRAEAAIGAAFDRLRDVQKMDAVGRLAGGLAHDFNNLLMVVDGHARFLVEAAASDEARSDAESILAAVQRGTTLTRQLMAFSGKRIDTLEAVDLNRMLERSQQMFERLVGPDIAIGVVTTPDLPAATTDAAQFEHVLVNLVSNARDAMPDGGTLTISTGPCPDARFVQVVVQDTGIGMDEATQARIFEPLFTTKPRGRGTGFGLATAQAVVAGSGGTIKVASKPGEGATFTIQLPVAGSAPPSTVDPARSA
jgi:signal transduction histidine kinase